MSFSFSIPTKSQSNRPKRPSASFSDADDPQPTTAAAAAAASPARNYVTVFNPVTPDSTVKPIIPPIPNDIRFMKKLKNLSNLHSLSQSNGSDPSLQFELDPGSNREDSKDSTVYGLNLRQVPAENGGSVEPDRRESIIDLELRKLREDLEKLPEDARMDEYQDVPVEGFGAALMAGYGWKEGMGIGRNTKEDAKFSEVTKKTGRGGIGFTEEIYEKQIVSNGNMGRDKKGDKKEKSSFDIGKEVRIVSGTEIGMKGKIAEVRRGGDVLVLRLSRTGEKVKVQGKDVAELGSAEEERCLRRLKELKIKEEKVDIGKRDGNSSRKTGREEESVLTKRVNWLRNHIRVRIISKELKGGRLFLKKGVVVDVVGPGVCDISMDESGELIQGVDQEFLETALPKRGGPVLVLLGRYKGVFGSLVERNSETGVVRDVDTHEMLNVNLEQIAEYTEDLSDVGY